MLKYDPPKNFGCVYIINLMYFLSRGTIPIYDQYACKAARALVEGITPDKIYVGPAPGKNDCKKVITMYSEYIHLLEKIFGTCNIKRKIDRALWVYGHYEGK